MKKYNKKQAQLEERNKEITLNSTGSCAEKYITIRNKWDIFSLFLILADFVLLLFSDFFSRFLLSVKIEVLYLGKKKKKLPDWMHWVTEWAQVISLALKL